ncbi:MAG: hypothetical protein AB8H47_19110 [Bacteroidia bacterium]
MRFFAPLALILLVSISSNILAHQSIANLPQSFKIWSDEGNILATDQDNIVSELIELEYITQARSMSIVEVSIRDAEGQIMAKRIISSDGGNLHSKIGVNRWAEGSYSLQVWIDGEEQTYSIKLIKNSLTLNE